jgi:hypothetical protein
MLPLGIHAVDQRGRCRFPVFAAIHFVFMRLWDWLPFRLPDPAWVWGNRRSTTRRPRIGNR